MFDESIAKEIEENAEIINELIFKPELVTPIKTLELPLGGKNHFSSSLSMIYELVKLLGANNEDDDDTGKETLNSLKKIRKSLQRINDSHPSSLGLHPAVYIYSLSGNFRISCFNAIIVFIEELNTKKKLNIFIDNRRQFEEIILQSDDIIQQIVRRARQSNKAIIPLVNYFKLILENLENEIRLEDVLNNIISTKEFSYLNLDSDIKITSGDEFSESVKNVTYISEAIANAPKCKICGGLLHSKSISFDHIIRKEDGGKGSADNAQLTHPYCNTTYKN